MRRTTRLSGQLPSPPKSFDGSLSSESTCESHNTRSSIIPDENTSNTPSSDRKTRVLRRQSTQNVSGELRAFFAVSALPSGKSKKDFLLAAVDRVSEFWEGPRKEPPRGQKRSQDDSDIPSKTQDIAEQPAKKRWLTSGLYAGSRTSADNSKILGKARKSDPGPGAGRKFKFTLPLFHGKNLMEQQRDFKLPWNFYATTGDNCKPPNWSRIKRNIHIDVDPYDKKADRPECLCRHECDETCLNRAMFYECDGQSCALQNPADCSNRIFQRAAVRYADHKARSCGFEVFNTGERGFGLRALRDFDPNAFILEYRGELISTEECEHRMATMYSDRSNYYFLNIDAYTVLDAGRKGTEARFANHCCAPNARIEKWIVKGEPRIGVFAGKHGIEAGDEITYDYNFVWFEGAKEQKCYCGAENCRGFIGKRKAAPPPPKLDLKANKKGKAGKAVVATKVKRVVNGKITKVATKKVKAQVKNGKVIKATIIIARQPSKKTAKSPTKAKVQKVMSIKSPTKAKARILKVVKEVKSPGKAKISSSAAKKSKGITPQKSMLGKRKRPDSIKKAENARNTKAGRVKSPQKPAPRGRTIAKPRSKKASESLPEPIPRRPVYDSVSNPARKRNVH